MPHFETLKKYFGYDNFRPGQEEIIQNIVNGNSVLAILPTGAGKSLCYQVPALMGSSFSLVVSPLIALMKDQVDTLNKKEQIAAFINSSLDYSEQEKVLNDLTLGKIKILYVAPEKLENISFTERIKNLHPSYLFIDEAHCISEWGHNFRPSYRKIKEFAEFIEIKRIAAFTATATPEVRDDIVTQLNLENPKIFVRGFERDNLNLHVIRTKYKKEKALEIIKKSELPAIIYTSTRKNTEEIASYLTAHGYSAQYYHAGMTAELRRIIQDDFINDNIKIIAATNAFGMGIDKSDIRLIIHYNMPGTIENYYQEMGRAGRDGNESNVYLLFEERDKSIQEFFITSSYPSREQIEFVYDTLFDYAGIALGSKGDKEIPLDKNFFTLLGGDNVSKGLLGSIINLLEEAGYLKKNSEFEKSHFVKFNISKDELKKYVTRIAGDYLKDLIMILMREHGSEIFSTKKRIDLLKLANTLGTDDKTIIESLSTLSNVGIIEYDRPSLMPSVKPIMSRIKAKDIVINYNSIAVRKDHAHAKLNKMIDFTQTDKCRMEFILNYFGEETNNYRCGKCDVCKGTAEVPGDSLEYLEEIVMETMHEAKGKLALNHVAAILTGKSRHPRFKKFSSFGSCKYFSKEEIVRSVENLVDKKLLHSFNHNLSLTQEGKNWFIFDTEEPEPIKKKSDYENDLELFNILRQARKDASKRYLQPPNLICSDDTLRKIANEKPVTPSRLLSVEGFTQRMYNKIGEDFVNIIKEFVRDKKDQSAISNKKLPENISRILDLVKKGYGLKDISSLSKLPEAVAAVQIETLLEFIPDLNIYPLFDKNELEMINRHISDGKTGMKELKELLPSSISYGKIRIALAKFRVG